MIPWQPKYWKDASDYIIACVDRLVELALRDDAIGSRARNGIAHQFRSYIGGGQIEQVERWVARVRAVHPYGQQR